MSIKILYLYHCNSCSTSFDLREKKDSVGCVCCNGSALFVGQENLPVKPKNEVNLFDEFNKASPETRQAMFNLINHVA